MTDAILDMRFNQNPEDPVDDEQFLHATYRAGIQVEKKKALKGARDLVRGAQPLRTTTEKEGKKRTQDNARKDSEGKEPRQKEERGEAEKGRWYGQKTSWTTKDEALKGVPTAEREEYGKSREDCWRCGRNGHKTYECYAGTTKRGTTLPTAPWKVSAVGQGKRKRDEEDTHPAKQQKVAAVETMETDAVAPLWEDSESDF